MNSPRRQQIEDAASSLFSRCGYAGTSVRDIARALDLQGGSLYAHIPSKESVLASIVEAAAHRFHAAVRPIARGPGPAAERLRVMIAAHVEVVTSDHDRATVFLHEWRFLDDERRARIAESRDAYERYFVDAIAAGVAAGELGAADPRLAAVFLLSALNGLALWYRPGGPLTPGEVADQFTRLFLEGVAADGVAAHLPAGFAGYQPG